MIAKPRSGFSLLETMVALAVLIGVSGIVMSGMVQMMKTQNTIGNRTEMHASVRSATELLQQEIGQAGKVSLGSPNASVTLGGAVGIAGTVAFSLNTTDPSQPPLVYPNEALTVDLGSNQDAAT